MLNKPKNQTAEVLYLLLTQKSITVKSAMNDIGILNLSARISNLRLKHNLVIECRKTITTNKFGRSITYGNFFLVTKKSISTKVYNQVNL
jgi:hypothetical protein